MREGIRTGPPLFTASQAATTMSHWPGYNTSNMRLNICEFPCFTVGKVLFPFHSEIGKVRKKIHLSISFFRLSQWHLRYAYLKQQMHRAHGTSSETFCEGIPTASELLPPFLLYSFEPSNL